MLLAALVMHEWVRLSGLQHSHSLATAPQAEAILVLGASVRPDGRPSTMLAERLRAAAELYRAGKAPKVLVSGDHGSRHYNEVAAMAEDLRARGVPDADIFMDHAGFRTFDSLVRAREVFGLDRVLVVSNPFHVPRAVFLGRSQGMEAFGVGADYGTPYSRRTRWRNQGREFLARLGAFADVYLLGTRPRHLGPRIDIRGDGRVTR